MKVKIITPEGNVKKCYVCGFEGFRKSTKSKYTNKEKTEGITYDLEICDRCGNQTNHNIHNWRIQKEVRERW